MRRNVKIAVGILISVSVLLLLRDANKNAQQLRPNATASQTHPINPSVEYQPASPHITPGLASPAQATQNVNTEAELKKYLMAHHPAAIETRIEKRDPFISRYRLLGRRKVLLSSEESHELDDLLGDREKWNKYQEHLQKVEFGAHAVAEEQLYRLFLLQYFESSFTHSKDPELLAFFIDFVMEDNFGRQLSREVKKSLAYEKIKVLGYLRQHSPESLDIIKQKMPGVRHEKLLRDFFEQPPEA